MKSKIATLTIALTLVSIALSLTACSGSANSKDFDNIHAQINGDKIIFSGSGDLNAASYDWGKADLSAIKNIEITGNITTISSLTNFSNLEYLHVTAALSAINPYAVSSLYRLEEVDLKDGGCVVIEDGAFMSCYKLTTIYASPDLRKLSTTAFEDCPSLSRIYAPNSDAMVPLGEYSSFYGGTLSWGYELLDED